MEDVYIIYLLFKSCVSPRLNYFFLSYFEILSVINTILLNELKIYLTCSYLVFISVTEKFKLLLYYGLEIML